MKKLLLIAFLMLALVITAVACTETPDEPGTSAEDVTTAETPTEAPDTDEPDTPAPDTDEPETPAPDTDEPETPAPDTDEPETPEPETEPPVDPADPVWIMGADELAAMTNANAATVEKNEAGYASFTATAGDPWFLVCGNIGEMPKYLVMRYRTNTTQQGEIFIGNGAGPEGGKSFTYSYNADGQWNLIIFHLPTVASYMTDGTVGHIRFDFYTGGPEDGAFLDVEYMAFFNTAEYALAYDFELHKAPMWDVDKAVLSHQSFDELDKYANGSKVEGVFTPGQSSGWDRVITLNDYSVDTLRYWGWISGVTEQGIFGYQINGGKAIYDEAWTVPEDLMAHAPQGSTYTTRMAIMISLEGLAGENTVRVLYKDAAGTEVCLNEFTVIFPSNVSSTFVSNVASNEDGTDLQASDLSNYFTITYGASEPHNVTGGVYQYGGINELYTAVDGVYAFSVNMLEAANTAMAFVRGTRVVHSVDLPEVDSAAGLYPINNYYETDGQGRMGGAGIYAALYNGRLNLMIKAYDDEARTHQINRDYSITTEGTELTIADNGSTVYIMVDGNLLATVALSGSTSYEKICDLAEGITFAQTAVVTLADGTTDTIENTLVVATVQSQLGIAVRPATIKFDSIKVLGFSDVEIPADFYVPEVKENLALNKPVDADSVENENNIPANATDGDESTRWGALPNGAANLIVDLEEVKALTGMDVLFENAGWNYEIAISEDGVDYTVIHTSEAHAGKILKLEGEVNARYIKFSRLDDSADTSTPHWFSIYEVYVYGKAEETEEPDAPVVESLVIPQDQWVISGHCTTLVGKEGHDNSPMVAAGGVDSAALLHQGSIALGEIDLSKYSKVVIMWGSDNGDGTKDLYAKNEHNRFALVNADKNMVMSPAEDTIIAAATYELHGWAIAPFEIDLTGIDYNGPVFLTHDSLAGGFALVYSIEFIA